MRYVTKSDLKIVAKDSAYLMIGIGMMCLIPIIIDLFYVEYTALIFLIPGLISMALGYALIKYFENRPTKKMRLKHGMMISSFAWFWAGIVGGVIFMLATHIPYIDAVFESVSALTGTGVTIYSNVEILPHSILFFRALEQWIGGLGVVVMVLGVLTKPNAITSKLYNSEAREERFEPSIRTTLKKTLVIYAIYTAFGIILYVLAGMPFFDSICNTFTTISTGGMNVKNANMGYYQSDLIYFITIVLMILGATSFLVHYKIIKSRKGKSIIEDLILRGKALIKELQSREKPLTEVLKLRWKALIEDLKSRGKALIEDLQFKVIITVIAFVTLMLYFLTNIVPMEILFTVVSAITTTGASVSPITSMASWPSFMIICLMCLMLTGGSNGSTVGAIKLYRMITFFKGIYKHVREILSPEGRVMIIKINGNKIPEKAISQSGNYITLYLMFIMFTWALFCLFGYDPFNSLFAAISLQGNNGLELGIINTSLNPILKVVCMLDMWTGRLEIYPVLISARAFFEVFKKIKFIINKNSNID